MTAQAKPGKGVKLVYNGWVLAETVDADPFKPKRSKDTGTSHDSEAAVHLPGELEYSDLTATVYAIDDACQTALEALMAAGTIGLWKFVYPSTFTYPFKVYVGNAWLSGFEPSTPRNGRATYKMTLTPVMTVTPYTTSGAALTTPFLSFKNQADEAISAVSPSPAAAVYKYAVTAFSDDTGIKITPTATTGTIYVNGTVVASGAASDAITLNLGTGAVTTIFVMVVESDVKTPKIYQIDVTIGTVASPP
jgi:hypothetical protein